MATEELDRYEAEQGQHAGNEQEEEALTEAGGPGVQEANIKV